MSPHSLIRHDGTDVRQSGRTRRLRSAVSLLVAFLLACAGIATSTGTAQAAAPDSHRPATWNMDQSRARWTGAYELAITHDVVALQEVPSTPPHAARHQGTVNGVDHYLWQEGERGEERHLYILRTPSRNLGMITSWTPDDVLNITSVYRPALGVIDRADGIMFASVHASSRQGGDSGRLLWEVALEAAAEGIAHWAAIGDFNIAPESIGRLFPPGNYRVYNPGQPTHVNGSEYDYMVANLTTDRWQATVRSNPGSDHWPVRFGALLGAAGPRSFTMEAQHSDLLLNVDHGNSANGTHVVQSQDHGEASRWFLRPLHRTNPPGQPLYRLVSATGYKCLDVHNGQHSKDGDYLEIDTCHLPDGSPEPGGYLHDTQNFTVEHPVAHQPNMTVLRNQATGDYVSISGNSTRDGAWAIQSPYETGSGSYPVGNETFYLHPTPQ
ncbi:RICIN domain-containing protein [Streptomyces lydicamycinicus]